MGRKAAIRPKETQNPDLERGLLSGRRMRNISGTLALLLAATPIALGCESEHDCPMAMVVPGNPDAGAPRAPMVVEIPKADVVAAVASNVTRFKLPLTPELPGTFGSGLAYDKSDDSYWMVTDRGNRTKEWVLRLVRVKLSPTPQIIAVLPLTEKGTPLTGADLDPEDISLAPDGTLWLGDEVKPYLLHVTRTGEVIERVAPPMNFIDHADDRGFEGLTVSADGKTIYGILQGGNKNEPDKLNTLIAAYDIGARSFKEYKYRLDDARLLDYPEEVKGNAHACGLATSGDGALNVLERDNQAGGNARLKRVYRIEIPADPPTTALPKTLVVDLYKLGYQKEKAEGLAVPEPGVLMIANDNDGDVAISTEIWRVKL